MRKALLLFALVCTAAQGAWAQTAQVDSQDELLTALQDETARQHIQLTGNINLNTTVTIPSGVTTHIDLNGHTLSQNAANNQVLHVATGASLTLSGVSGVITGGNATNGGAILNEGSLTITDITISDNHAAEGGALYNSPNATCTINGGIIKDNTVSGKGGGIANYGTMTFLAGLISGNTSADHGGGVYVANGATFAMKGGEVKENTSTTKLTSGICVEGTLQMEGNVTVNENIIANVTLLGFSLINVTGAIEETAKIGVSNEVSGIITKGFAANNPDLDFAKVFFSDLESHTLSLDGDELALCNSSSSETEFYHGQWDEVEKKVVYTKKYATAYTLTNQTSLSGWYVVSQNHTNANSRVTINDDTNIILQDGAKLTLSKGIYVKDGKTLTIYGQQQGTGHLECSADSYNAGIGGNKDVKAGYVVIHGGTVTANGDDDGAGIGGGYGDGSGVRGVTIYGGKVYAYGLNGGAGIGKGKNNNVWEDIRIYGGTIQAWGGYSGAGLGGSYNRGNGNIWIYGGSIEALCHIPDGVRINTWMEKRAGAGIGGGREGSQDRPINIYGGTIYAKGVGGAGIGGGGYGNGGVVNIYGGNVTALSVGRGAGIGGGNEGKGGMVYIADEATVHAKKSWGEAACIGHGKDNNDNGKLTLGDLLMASVHEDYPLTEDLYFLSSERVRYCRESGEIFLELCTHPSGFTYTADAASHTSHCKHCLFTETHAHEYLAATGTCICGKKSTDQEFCQIQIATVDGDKTNYEAVLSGGVVKGQPFTLPACSRVPDGYDFAGWLVTAASAAAAPATFEVQPGEQLLQPGDTYTPNDDAILWARYDGILLTLDADMVNTFVIEEYAGKKAAQVCLENRTFWTDGQWNTLCLPFDVPVFTGTPLKGATVKTLVSSSFDNSTGTLTLNFSNDLTSIEAGKPYIVKWTDSEYASINGPTFDDVTIKADYTGVTTDDVVFRGNFGKIALVKDDTSVLFLGAQNTLYYPNDDMTVKGFCCIFELQDGLTAGNSSNGVRAFALNFGDGETTAVREALSVKSAADAAATGWYTLDGRRLSGKPTQKGIYINNDKKVVIK